jgi:signal transduction histidine kinase
MTPVADELDAFADATTAVIAHALLNSMAVISGAASLLLEHELSAEDQRNLLERVHAQAGHVTGILQDLVRGLPGSALDALGGLGPLPDERSQSESQSG